MISSGLVKRTSRLDTAALMLVLIIVRSFWYNDHKRSPLDLHNVLMKINRRMCWSTSRRENSRNCFNESAPVGSKRILQQNKLNIDIYISILDYLTQLKKALKNKLLKPRSGLYESYMLMHMIIQMILYKSVDTVSIITLRKSRLIVSLSLLRTFSRLRFCHFSVIQIYIFTR